MWRKTVTSDFFPRMIHSHPAQSWLHVLLSILGSMQPPLQQGGTSSRIYRESGLLGSTLQPLPLRGIYLRRMSCHSSQGPPNVSPMHLSLCLSLIRPKLCFMIFTVEKRSDIYSRQIGHWWQIKDSHRSLAWWTNGFIGVAYSSMSEGLLMEQPNGSWTTKKSTLLWVTAQKSFIREAACWGVQVQGVGKVGFILRPCLLAYRETLSHCTLVWALFVLM